MTCLFAHYHYSRIGKLCQAHCSTVTQAERLIEAWIMRNRQYAAGFVYSVTLDDHRTVVQRSVLVEYLFDETCRNLCIYFLALSHKVAQIIVTLYDDQGAHLLCRHVSARMHHLVDPLMVVAQLQVRTAEGREQRLPLVTRTETYEHLSYLTREDYDDRNHSDVDETVEDRTQKTHLDDLRYHKPDDEYDHNTLEDHKRSALPCHPVEVIKNSCNRKYVKSINDSEVPHDCSKLKIKNEKLIINTNWLEVKIKNLN